MSCKMCPELHHESLNQNVPESTRELWEEGNKRGEEKSGSLRKNQKDAFLRERPFSQRKRERCVSQELLVLHIGHVANWCLQRK